FTKLREEQPRAVVTTPKSDLEGIEFTKDAGADVSFNVDLPLIAQDVDDVRVALPGGGAAWIDADDVDVYDVGERPERPSGKDLVKTAPHFDGLRYLWAGARAHGSRSSAYTSRISRAPGSDRPRDWGDPAMSGKAVSSSDLTAGE